MVRRKVQNVVHASGCQFGIVRPGATRTSKQFMITRDVNPPAAITHRRPVPPNRGENFVRACRAPGATSYMVITGQLAVPVFRSCWDPGWRMTAARRVPGKRRDKAPAGY